MTSTSCTDGAGTEHHSKSTVLYTKTCSNCRSIGLTLVDTLDDMVNQGRIEPQLAMKVVSRFDKAIAEVLSDKVKARLNFKVRRLADWTS